MRHVRISHPHRGGTERDKRQIVRRFIPGSVPIAGKPKVLQVLKQSDEVYDLPTRLPGFSQGERFDCGSKAPKVSLDPRHEAGDVRELEIEYRTLANVRNWCGVRRLNIFGESPTEPYCPHRPTAPDQGEQAKHVHVPEETRPQIFSAVGGCFNGKYAIEMGNGGDVPGVTG